MRLSTLRRRSVAATQDSWQSAAGRVEQQRRREGGAWRGRSNCLPIFRYAALDVLYCHGHVIRQFAVHVSNSVPE